MNNFKFMYQSVKRVISLYHYFHDQKNGKLVPKEQALSKINQMIEMIDACNHKKI